MKLTRRGKERKDQRTKLNQKSERGQQPPEPLHVSCVQIVKGVLQGATKRPNLVELQLESLWISRVKA